MAAQGAARLPALGCMPVFSHWVTGPPVLDGASEGMLLLTPVKRWKPTAARCLSVRHPPATHRQPHDCEASPQPTLAASHRWG